MSYTCPECNKVFLRACNYNSHMKTHPTVEEFQCKKCSKSFKFKQDYKEHINTVHIIRTDGTEPKNLIKMAYRKKPKKKSSPKKKKIRICKYCSKEFIRRDKFISHENAHLGFKAFKCKLCHQEYMGKEALNYHLKVHQGLKPFECPKCNLRFILKCSLNSHMRKRHPTDVNIKKKMVRCKFCSCFYKATKGVLTQHIKTIHPEKYFPQTKTNLEKRIGAKSKDHVDTGGYRRQVVDDVGHVDDDDDESVAIEIFLYYISSLN